MLRLGQGQREHHVRLELAALEVAFGADDGRFELYLKEILNEGGRRPGWRWRLFLVAGRRRLLLAGWLLLLGVVVTGSWRWDQILNGQLLAQLVQQPDAELVRIVLVPAGERGIDAADELFEIGRVERIVGVAPK